ncbi:hypothetical protein WJX74_009494 [Apatococcus lobatus]|uniref:Uncharacterized protein n=1 Tax=Apatococcus lobatus TaxID=904363 RepID=A0AAW1RFB5_9CHLO
MECEYEQKQGEAVFKVAREQIASGDPVAALQEVLLQHCQHCRGFKRRWQGRPSHYKGNPQHRLGAHGPRACMILHPDNIWPMTRSILLRSGGICSSRLLCRRRLRHHLQMDPAGNAADVAASSVRPGGKSIKASGAGAERAGNDATLLHSHIKCGPSLQSGVGSSGSQ